MENAAKELEMHVSAYESLNGTFIKNFPKGFIAFREFSKEDLIKIVETDENGIEDFVIFDIACILVDSKINFENLIYLIHFEKKNSVSMNDMIMNIMEFIRQYPNSIIVTRKGIPSDLKDTDTLNKFVSEITAIQKAGFADINNFCQLENSMPFVFLHNTPSRELYEEITTMVFRRIEFAESDD